MEAGPFTARPVRRFRLGIGEAVLVSLALHLLLLFWMAFGGAADLLLVPLRPAAAALGSDKGPSSLQFTFVDLPDDKEVPENPRARLLSDKTREARQSVPTPPDATLSPDPHSVGTAAERRAGSPSPPQAARPASPTPSRPIGESRPTVRSGDVGKPDGAEDPLLETNPKADEGPEESSRGEGAG